MQAPLHKEMPLPSAQTASDAHAPIAANIPTDCASPARQLQQELHQQLSTDTQDITVERWSLSRTIAFVTVICCLFWVSIVLTISALVSL